MARTQPEDAETIESLTRDLLELETEESTIRNRIVQLQVQIRGNGIEPGEAPRLRLEQLKAADANVEQNARRWTMRNKPPNRQYGFRPVDERSQECH